MGAAAKKLDPKPELISLAEVARRCGIHVQTCKARLEDLGYEPDPTSTAKLKLFPFDDEMMFAVKAAKGSLTAAKIHGTRLDNEIKGIKLAEARGELVPMHEAIEMVQDIVAKLYQEFTVRQPKRIAPRLAKAKNVTAVKKVLKTDTDRIMKNLRENFERFIT
jgi:hypothetical protein